MDQNIGLRPVLALHPHELSLVDFATIYITQQVSVLSLIILDVLNHPQEVTLIHVHNLHTVPLPLLLLTNHLLDHSLF